MQFPIRFVLCETSHPGNIGAAARAIKTMGFNDLVLVNPQDFPSGQADARASGAVDLLRNARVCTSLAEAVADCGRVFGASARRRSLRWPERNPRECAADALASSAEQPVALVFGTERSGLQNEQLDLCNALVCIPANPEYSSLNLAAAVQIIAYELRVAAEGFEAPQPADYPPASSGDMEQFYAHLWKLLTDSGFLKEDSPRQLKRKLRRLFTRADVNDNEVNILRGVLASLEPNNKPATRQDAVAGSEQDERRQSL